MTDDLSHPLDLVLRRRAAYMTLAEVLSGDLLIQAMWMIEERDQSADRLTFLGFVGVTAEIFGVDNHNVSILYIKLNKNLNLPHDDLPPDPLPEMLKFRGIIQSDAQLNVNISPSDTESTLIIDETSPSIYRDDGIFGKVEEDFTLATLYQIGQALASEAREYKCDTVIMARDGRNSSIGLGQSLAEGILSTGTKVIDLGAAPISVLYFVTHHFEGKTGVMVSGGHHPSQYNGLTMVVGGEILAGEKIQQLKQRIHNEDFIVGQGGSLEKTSRFVEEYVGMVAEYIQLNKPMKIVLDSGNGIAGTLAKEVMQEIGCEVIELHENVDESYPNHPPDPGKLENLKDLISAVRQHQAEVGFAFDNEGASLALVDSQGEIISPNQQLMLLAKAILTVKPNSQIILDAQCTNQLTELITQHGGTAIMCEAGSASMRTKLNATGAKLAGDMKGHFLFNDRWYGFSDALYAASRMLEILSSESRSSSEIFMELCESANTAEVGTELNESSTGGRSLELPG